MSINDQHLEIMITIKQIIIILLSVIAQLFMTLFSLILKFIRMVLANQRIDDITSRHVIITGCGSGFGRETALLLSRMGLQVHAGVHRQESIESLRKEYGTGSNLHIDVLDVGNDESVNQFCKNVRILLGEKHLWSLINNAGLQGTNIESDFVTIEDYQWIMNVNFYGAVRMVHQCRPLMSEADGGRLVFLTSMSCFGHLPYVSAYAASKSALYGYAKSLRGELGAQSNILVSTCVPGYFPTKLAESDSVTNFGVNLDRLAPEDRALYREDVVDKRIHFLKSSVALLVGSNSVDMVAQTLADLVTSKRPQADVWVCWDWISAKLRSICPDETGLWFVEWGRLMFDDGRPDLSRRQIN